MNIFIYNWDTERVIQNLDEDGNVYTIPFTVIGYGVTEDSKSVCIRLNSFKPSFKVMFPSHWSDSMIKEHLQFIRKRYFKGKWTGCLARIKKKCHRFDGFTNNENFTFIEFKLEDMLSFWRYRKVFTDPFEPYSSMKKKWLKHIKVYDIDLESSLKVFHEQNIPTCSWLTLEDPKPSKERWSRCDLEYSVHYKEIKQANIKLSTVQPPILTASFDLECTRGGNDGGFPQYDDEDDCIIQIGTTIRAYNAPPGEFAYKYIGTLGGCIPIDECIVESYETEVELILGWARFIQTKVHVLTGYNIVGFDMRYIYKRAEMLEIEEEFLDILSWLNNAPAKYVETVLTSSGLGHNELYRIDIPGVVSLDVMKVLQGDPSIKLDSWKLDHVAEIYVGQKKVDVKPKEIFELQKGSDADRQRIAIYCIQDCALCNLLIDKLCLLTNNMAMANVCSVPLSYIFTRGQGIKIFSLVAKYCYEENFAIPAKNRFLQRPTTKYQGAIVLNMEPGYYDEPITVLDFASLYPSSQIAANLSHDTLVTKGGKYDNIEGIEYTDVEFMEDDELKSYRWASTAGKPGILPTILKKLLSERKCVKRKMKSEKNTFMKQVLDGQQLALKVTCNSVYGQTGAFTSNIYLRPLAACTTALGRKHLMFSKDFVETNYPGYRCIYGDTDSIFISGPKIDDKRDVRLKDAVINGEKIANEITKAIGKEALVLEYEKVYYPFGMLKRKRYIGMKFEAYTDKGKLITMGDAMKRRDSAPIVKDIYGGLIKQLFPKIDVAMERDSKGILTKTIQGYPIIRQVRTKLKEILKGEIPLDRFIITVTLRSNYKRPKSIPHKVLADRITERDPGNAPQSNDRMAFVYIERLDIKKTVPGDTLETPEFVMENKLKLDYLHYIEHQLKTPLSQLISLFMPQSPFGAFEDILKAAKKDFRQRKREVLNKIEGYRDIDSFF